MPSSKENRVESNKRYYQKHKERILEYQKTYFEVNKEHVLKTIHEYRDSNRDLIRERQRESYRKKIIIRMLSAARIRAEKRGLDFNIDETDIVIPEKCPLLEIEIKIAYKVANANSPSLDRIDSSKGYVKGNVMVISYRANTIKSNATPSELLKLASNLIKYVSQQHE